MAIRVSSYFISEVNEGSQVKSKPNVCLNDTSLPFIHGFELNICLTYQTILIRVLTNYSILLHILIKVGRLKYFG